MDGDYFLLDPILNESYEDPFAPPEKENFYDIVRIGDQVDVEAVKREIRAQAESEGMTLPMIAVSGKKAELPILAQGNSRVQDFDESWIFDQGKSFGQDHLLHPELDSQLHVRTYDPLRMHFHHHRLGEGSRLPPRHIQQMYLKEVEGRERCEECNRSADDAGIIKHENWCSSPRICPGCGGTQWEAEDLPGIFVVCKGCGYMDSF